MLCLTPPSEPCQPTNLTVDGLCDLGAVKLNWSVAQGASVYVVTITGGLGYNTSFQTAETAIDAELPCGQQFSFTVKAQDAKCDSAVSLPGIFRTSKHLVYIYTITLLL